MTKAGERIIAGAQEALAYARGQSDLRASLSPGDRVGPNGEYVVVPVGAARAVTNYADMLTDAQLGRIGRESRDAMLAALKRQDK